MLNKKEITLIIVLTIVLAFAVSLVETLESFLYAISGIFFVLIINISAKKISSFYLDSEIEIKLWEIKRYGFSPGKYFKRPFPAGILIPLFSAALTFGNLVWMAILVFDVKPKIYRSAKRHGLYNFSEMTEYHMGLIAVSGVIANLIFAIIGYLIGFENFSRLNVYYAFFNMIPLSDLDGNKIFFGNIIIWAFIASITLIELGYVFLLI